jgi:peptidoglycan hydrolase CwlO-like protein
MENTSEVNVNVVLDKKMGGYGVDSRLQNFIAPQEITITITLSEYRELVSKVATRDADISRAESDKYERCKKIEALEKEVRELKAKIYELQNPTAIEDEI